MSKYSGCGLAYVSGYDPGLFMEEELDDDEINDSEGYEEEVEFDDYDYDYIEDYPYIDEDVDDAR